VSAGIDYPDILRRATLGLVREVLERAAAEGLPGEHHFFLSFQTGHPGVRLPADLRQRFPETMTVVLQHQFWDLVIEPEAFEVTLRFGGSDERLRVPFDALTAFLDPSVPFGLDFTQFVAADATGGGAGEAAPATAGDSPPDPTAAQPAGGERGGDVLPFRRREE
jgi:hypothetical protein